RKGSWPPLGRAASASRPGGGRRGGGRAAAARRRRGPFLRGWARRRRPGRWRRRGRWRAAGGSRTGCAVLRVAPSGWVLAGLQQRVFKSELRISKSETNPNIESELTETAQAGFFVSVLSASDFGFVSDFGFRYSDFSSHSPMTL